MTREARELRPDRPENYSIERPFEGDHAPCKVVYTSPWNGSRVIVHSAYTEERAKLWLYKWLDGGGFKL